MNTPFSHLRTVSNDDGAAVLDGERGRLIILNSTGALVWDGLERGESTGHIAGNLAIATGLDAASIENDVCLFVEQLREQNLVRD